MRFLKLFTTITLALMFSLHSMAANFSADVLSLFSARTTTGYSSVFQPQKLNKSFQAYGTTSSGSGAATIKIWCSNVVAAASGTDVDWVLLGTISLTLGTTQTTDGFASAAAWRNCKAEVDAISGTGASVTVIMGLQSNN